jgi:hypothetical protein
LRWRLGVRQKRQNTHVTAEVWIIVYEGISFELKHMEKGKIKLHWEDLYSSPPPPERGSQLRNGLAAGTFTGTTEV